MPDSKIMQVIFAWRMPLLCLLVLNPMANVLLANDEGQALLKREANPNWAERHWETSGIHLEVVATDVIKYIGQTGSQESLDMKFEVEIFASSAGFIIDERTRDTKGNITSEVRTVFNAKDSVNYCIEKNNGEYRLTRAASLKTATESKLSSADFFWFVNAAKMPWHSVDLAKLTSSPEFHLQSVADAGSVKEINFEYDDEVFGKKQFKVWVDPANSWRISKAESTFPWKGKVAVHEVIVNYSDKHPFVPESMFIKRGTRDNILEFDTRLTEVKKIENWETDKKIFNIEHYGISRQTLDLMLHGPRKVPNYNWVFWAIAIIIVGTSIYAISKKL